jgi:S-adenosylmethionine:tRNA ribosyltransferase-isomerase
MRVEEFDYELPRSAIAQSPAPERDASRLLVLYRESGEVEEAIFRDLPKFLKEGDVLALNDTKVIKARLFGKKESGGKCEVFLLKDLGEGKWEALLRPSRRLKPGSEIIVGEVKLRVLERKENGTKVIAFPEGSDPYKIMERYGQLPLPPYIREKPEDPERYQTVFSRTPGSTAASTAALHFTERLIQELKEKGVRIVYFTLHMGLGSFRPIRSENVEDHQLPPEFYVMPEETAQEINLAKKERRRVIACGTGAVRTIEGCANEEGLVRSGYGWTDLFITPGYRFKVIDGMITNFHLPRSSHLVLVCAFAGREKVLEAYREALKRGFRFLSFGDAMLII